MSGGRAGGPCSEGPYLGAGLGVGWGGGFLYSEIRLGPGALVG